MFCFYNVIGLWIPFSPQSDPYTHVNGAGLYMSAQLTGIRDDIYVHVLTEEVILCIDR